MYMAFPINPTQCYLELARAARDVVFQHAHLSQEEFTERHGVSDIFSTMYSVSAMVVLFSYISVEAYTNLCLYNVWCDRHKATNEARNFLEIFGDVDSFEEIKLNKKGRELKKRINAYCEIMGFEKPAKAIPRIWQEFCEEVQFVRHFMTHPHPEETVFVNAVNKILWQGDTEMAVRVAEEILKYFHRCLKQEEPEWLSRNTLFNIPQIDLLRDIS